MLLRLSTARLMGPSLSAVDVCSEPADGVCGEAQAEETSFLKRFRLVGLQQWSPQMVPSPTQPRSSCSVHVQSHELVE